MRKRFILLLICAVGLLLAACAPGEAEDSGVMEEIRSAPVVKLEYARQEGGEPVFCYDPVSMSSLAEMRIQPSQGEFTEDWVYRFTYNPREKVIDGHEIVVLFGETSMSVDGVTYLPEDGVPYGAMLEWAEGKYAYFAGE